MKLAKIKLPADPSRGTSIAEMLKMIQANLKQLSRPSQVLRRASEKVFVPLTVGGGIKEFTDAEGKYHSALDVAAEYFRSGADKVSIGSDAVDAAEKFLRTGIKSGTSSIEQISWVQPDSLSLACKIGLLSSEQSLCTFAAPS